MKYALLAYQTTNLGDEIQSIAAQQFLPSTDLLVDRDQPNRLPVDAEGRYKIIFNGWHSHRPENWPPSPQLEALAVSMHISNETPSLNKNKLRPAEVLLRGANLDYLKAHAPVGARDLWTLDLLNTHGVDAYFSGCMTLTIGPGTEQARGDYVCAVGLRKPALQRLREMVRGQLVEASHENKTLKVFDARIARARKLLSVYAHAKCVVTSKLHCALPCLALGTPVLFVIAAPDSYRFSGLREFTHNCSQDEFVRGSVNFDPNNPPPNGTAYRAYREALIEKANRFIDPSRDAAAPLHPFEPETDVDALLASVTTDARRGGLLRRLFG
jgi:hypothetical protein